MARSETTGKKPETTGKKIDPIIERDAYDIGGFCERHSISVPQYYKMRARGEEMPDVFYSGSKPLISKEAAARWRAKREADAKQNKQAAATA
jgi:hypothetical protein